MSAPRDPAKVIDQILDVIPAAETFLRAELDKIRSDSWFLPPEGKYRAWRDLQLALLDRFPEPVLEGWPVTVNEIVQGRR